MRIILLLIITLFFSCTSDNENENEQNSQTLNIKVEITNGETVGNIIGIHTIYNQDQTENGTTLFAEEFINPPFERNISVDKSPYGGRIYINLTSHNDLDEMNLYINGEEVCSKSGHQPTSNSYYTLTCVYEY